MAVRSRNAAMAAAEKEKKMIAERKKMIRMAGQRSSYLTAEQSRMLSYLSRDELKRWNSYSPMRQRKIMEEVEKRLARQGKVEPSDDWQPAGSDSYYIDNFSEEAEKTEGERQSGSYSGEAEMRFLHEKRDAPIRTVEPAPIRSKEMIMRMELPAASSSKTRRRGPKSARGHPGLKIAAEREAQGTTDKAGKRPAGSRVSEAKSLNRKAVLRRQSEGRDRSQQPFPGIRDDHNEADLPNRAGKQMMIRNTAKGNSDKRIENGKGDPPYFNQEIDRKQVQRAMHQRELAKEIRTDREADAGNRKSGEPGKAGTLGKAGEPFHAAGMPVETETALKAGQSRADAATSGSDMAFVQAGSLVMNKGADKKTGIASTASQKGSAAAALARVENTRRRKLVTGRDRFEKQDVLKKAGGRRERETKGSVMSGIRSRRESRKKEASYRKAFVTELRRIVSRDLRKSENIRQAQKSGQISATVSELTGQTARSAVSTAALPIHAAMKVLTKRLREEFKKKMKEAVAALGRYAVSLGGPILIILLIVMLLGGILMAFISEEKENSGYGLGFQIVQEAMKHIGLPYVYGGTDLETGCDCSGFVWAVYNKFGYNLPRTAGDQYAYGRKISSNMEDWQLGDLIYYSRTGSVQSGGGRAEHIVIYAGNGQVISCGPVNVYPWDYRSDYYGTCRIIPDEPEGGDFSGSTNEEICWNYFISQGFSKAAAAGILGNMYVESGGTFDPSIHQYGGGPGRGLCQWEESYSGGSGRYNQLAAFAGRLGLAWDDITVQLMFVTHELGNGSMNPYFSKWGGVENFKHMTDPAEATYVFLCGFEYCGDPGRGFLESNFSLSTRVSHAQWAYTYYS